MTSTRVRATAASSRSPQPVEQTGAICELVKIRGDRGFVRKGRSVTLFEGIPAQRVGESQCLSGNHAQLARRRQLRIAS